jgi:YHS domain-containing protein
MNVDRAKAITKELGGEKSYFCSNHCMHAFEADPEQYLRRSASAHHEHVAHANH